MSNFPFDIIILTYFSFAEIPILRDFIIYLTVIFLCWSTWWTNLQFYYFQWPKPDGTAPLLSFLTTVEIYQFSKHFLNYNILLIYCHVHSWVQIHLCHSLSSLYKKETSTSSLADSSITLKKDQSKVSYFPFFF